ncbi:hypothetical protein KQH62_05965 [bacterium]|nr:hypothetical protein [bacterium]
MTVHEDGSGVLRFALGVESASYDLFQEQLPEGMDLEGLLATLMQDENVTEVTTDQYEGGGRVWEVVELQVADFAALLTEERRIGPLVIALDESEGLYAFEEVIDLENSTMSIPGIHLMDLAGAGYTVRLDTPQIITTNGLQTDAGVSTWEVSIGDLVEGGETIVLEADYSLEPYEGNFIPWETFFPYVMIGFLGLGVLAILVVIVVNTRKKKDQGDKIKFDL